MIAFQVNDMTCGHCASTITKAVKAADPDAKVMIDLGKHLVMIEPVEAEADELREAIADAGYSPAAAEASAADPKPGAGSCCGR